MKYLISIFLLILTQSLLSLTLINRAEEEPLKNKTLKEAQGIAVGDTVRNFLAKDVNDSLFSLQNALSQGPVVVVFYRGHWCPICNQHLKELQDSFESIYAKGASIVAVSPEKPEFLKQTQEKTHASFTLISDTAYLISAQFDVAFKPKDSEALLYNTLLGAKLKEAHSDDSQRLPIPATFILNKEGIVVWRHFDPNYKKRSSAQEILSHIPTS
jgi:peroxiredoxin